MITGKTSRKAYGFITVEDLFRNGPVGCKILDERPVGKPYICIMEYWKSMRQQYSYALYFKDVKLSSSYDDVTLEALSRALSMLKGTEVLMSYGYNSYRPITDRRSITLKTAGIWGL